MVRAMPISPPPGHLPLITAGTSVVEFSPTADLPAVRSMVGANMEGVMS